MYVIVPQIDSLKHDLTSGACDCIPQATILSNGEILLVHNRVSTKGESKWIMTTEPDSLEIEERRTFERLKPKSPKGRVVKEGVYPEKPDDYVE